MLSIQTIPPYVNSSAASLPSKRSGMPTFGSSPTNPADEKDILREAPLRYWGYVNEMFESVQDLLRVFMPKEKAAKLVHGSYGIVDKYVYVDAFDKGVRGFKQAQKAGLDKNAQIINGVEQSVDAGLFQTAASLYLPALFISLFRDVSKFTLMLLTKDAAGAKELMDEIKHHTASPKFADRNMAKLKLAICKQLEKPFRLRTRLSQAGRKSIGRMPVLLSKGLPMMVSLALMPVVVHPIDKLVNIVMNLTYRPVARILKENLFGITLPQGHTVSGESQTESKSFYSHVFDPHQPLSRNSLHQHFSAYR